MSETARVVRRSGHALLQEGHFLCGVRYSILPALASTKTIAPRVMQGSITRERFLNFLWDDVASNHT